MYIEVSREFEKYVRCIKGIKVYQVLMNVKIIKDLKVKQIVSISSDF